MASDYEAVTSQPQSKRFETVAFIFLTLVLFPVLAIVFVGGFGFIVWMQQLVFGPPGV
ncbi:periplasmic nitrate reductase, NapE protein [Notoacmeibacter sp. MSK16QG-6]|uniref:periplasmic nitrate reductase, NapE protein n=1 Tax=Notoacmeibacter sp. MSK16QG-6 TaxID=2957982 RepID=UPI00209DB983|nr:periplasmic nitrate reductase, NapE protein [Notoacmeibacter sp. MSK16QG-6]MCP1200508.1 periplasmic nitrate reductase, NapE protein [Notoacmeibacter sp. MSK16QG-6]